jgi:hypothetical protein
MGRVRIRDLPLDRVRRRPELRYVTGQGRGGGARRGPGAPRDMARDRVRREVGAAIRDWSRPRWGDVLGRGRDVPTGPEWSPGVNTYIPRSHKGKGWSGQ